MISSNLNTTRFIFSNPTILNFSLSQKGKGKHPKMLAIRTAEKFMFRVQDIPLNKSLPIDNSEGLWSSQPRVKRPNLIKRATRKILSSCSCSWRVIYPEGPRWHPGFFPGEASRWFSPNVRRGGIIPSWRLTPMGMTFEKRQLKVFVMILTTYRWIMRLSILTHHQST